MGFSNSAYASGLYSDAADWLQVALDKFPHDYSLQLRMSRWARYGIVPFEHAKEMLLKIVDNAPPNLARNASIDLLNLCWERAGAAAAVVHLPGTMPWLGSKPAMKLRLAALMHDAGLAEEALELLAEVANEHPRSLRNMGYLELTLAAQKAGFNHLAQARKAAAVAQRLDAGTARLQSLLDTRDVAVVANGRSLKGRSLGSKIDAHRNVMRFNNYATGDVIDLGQRTDIWVRPPFPQYVPWRKFRKQPLLLFTGPNLRHRFSDAVQLLAACPEEYGDIAVVPSSLYAKLFKELEASPSSGILGLALLAEHWGNRVPQTRVFGYSLEDNRENMSIYHHGSVQGDRPSRHNWKAELRLFQNLVETEQQ
ncbi:glycosyltransferase family 29 protein [Sinorhizobium mexicanum]|uniref:glycosyltransferase family 29 protein n=1 Tax=Sinorhizobium mexicanum TaxID=375549 RepID=UPI0015DE8BF3|nr:glycosyltransferase family 29 protein [Sinorhizobium mexicanum]MBP1888120.1 tetratricopeptide (TPR) repeat protein [Sinorhizobium mexicanum]